MRLVCINQFIDAISAMLLGGYLGNWLDRHDRRFGEFLDFGFFGL
jgi:lipoprotein signal peptidase